MLLLSMILWWTPNTSSIYLHMILPKAGFSMSKFGSTELSSMVKRLDFILSLTLLKFHGDNTVLPLLCNLLENFWLLKELLNTWVEVPKKSLSLLLQKMILLFLSMESTIITTRLTWMLFQMHHARLTVLLLLPRSFTIILSLLKVDILWLRSYDYSTCSNSLSSCCRFSS